MPLESTPFAVETYSPSLVWSSQAIQLAFKSQVPMSSQICNSTPSPYMIDVPPTANSPQIAPVVYYVDLIAPGSTNTKPAFTIKHAPSSLPTSYLAVTAFEIDSSTAQACWGNNNNKQLIHRQYPRFILKDSRQSTERRLSVILELTGNGVTDPLK